MFHIISRKWLISGPNGLLKWSTSFHQSIQMTLVVMVISMSSVVGELDYGDPLFDKNMIMLRP